MPLAGTDHTDIALGGKLPCVITITAEPGVDALAVSRLVARECGVPLVGAETLDSVAANTGLPLDVVTELLMRTVSADDRGELWSRQELAENASQSKNDVIREARRTIGRLTAGRTAVIACHGAAEALTGEPRALHVLLRGPHQAHRPQGRFDIVLACKPNGIEAAAREIMAVLRSSTPA